MSLKKDCALYSIFVLPMLLVGCGTGTTPSSPPATSVARFAFVANSSSNSISSYAIDPATGQLTPKNAATTGGMAG